MRREDLHIPEPCHADWDGMTGDDKKRFCDACTKHVHNLSEMTREEASTLIKTSSNLCVQYASHSSGEVFFRDSTHPMWRLHRQVEGTKKLLAAALSIPMLAGAIAGCDAPDDPSPGAVSPVIQINPDGTLKAPGAGVEPTFTPPTVEPEEIEHLQGEPMVEPQPSTHPEKFDEVEEFLGDIAMPEEEPIQDTLGKVAIDHDPPKADGDAADEPACDPGSSDNAVKSSDAHDDNIKKVGTPLEHKMIRKTRGKMVPSYKLKKDS